MSGRITFLASLAGFSRWIHSLDSLQIRSLDSLAVFAEDSLQILSLDSLAVFADDSLQIHSLYSLAGFAPDSLTGFARCIR